MVKVTSPAPARAVVWAAGRIPAHGGGRPTRLVILDTTGPAPVRVDVLRTPAPDGAQ